MPNQPVGDGGIRLWEKHKFLLESHKSGWFFNRIGAAGLRICLSGQEKIVIEISNLQFE